MCSTTFHGSGELAGRTHLRRAPCGGFTEVAKGMGRDAIDPGKLVDDAQRLDVNAVVRRLGLLLETFEVSAPSQLERLQASAHAE